MNYISSEGVCGGCPAGCRTRADHGRHGPPPNGLRRLAVLVYGVPLTALIASVVLVDALGMSSALWSLCVIAVALAGACGLVIGSGGVVQARLETATDPVRIVQ